MNIAEYLVFKSGNTQLEWTFENFKPAVDLWLRGEHDNAVKEFIRISKPYRHKRMGDLNKKPVAYGSDRCDYHNGLESTKERLKSISKFIIDNRDKPMTPLESLGFSGNVNRMRDDFDLWYRDCFGSWAYHEDKKRNAIKMKWFCREMRKIEKIVDTREKFR